ncbi:MAG: SRPBCC family protein [Nocardiaceae bacterium]|nr:SRPBCC family protein [Nocardiaceae bacterium]
MATIFLQRTIKAPVEDVFDAYVDHASWIEVPGVFLAKVVRPGDIEPNGLGAIREIAAPGAWFREAITAFDRPHRMEYKVLKSVPPLRHDLGLVEFRQAADGTLVSWTSHFHSKIPFTDGLLKQVGTQIFSLILRTIDKRLTAKV